MMNQQERNELATSLAYMCEYYNRQMSKQALQMMVEDLSDLSFTEVNLAMTTYRRDPKNFTFPLPAKLRDIVNPSQSIDGMANEAASRIRSAIGKFGWPNPQQAKEYVGELGWLVVERSGGWQYVCENHGVDLNQLTFHAQARDQAKAVIESSKIGKLDQPVMIGEAIPKTISNILQIKAMPK
jgi:VCBS repeat-containing protein